MVNNSIPYTARTGTTTLSATMLEERMYKLLADKYSLTPEDARNAGLHAVEADTALALGLPAREGIVIPYYDPKTGELLTDTYRVRYFAPMSISGRLQLFAASPAIVASPYSPAAAYFPPTIKDWPRIQSNPRIPLQICTDELRALAASKRGIVTIAVVPHTGEANHA